MHLKIRKENAEELNYWLNNNDENLGDKKIKVVTEIYNDLIFMKLAKKMNYYYRKALDNLDKSAGPKAKSELQNLL